MKTQGSFPSGRITFEPLDYKPYSVSKHALFSVVIDTFLLITIVLAT
jgi:hypothetical protein